MPLVAACLPLLLYSLQKIDWSWWAIFAPAYGPLYLFVVLACGLCGLRLTTCRPCELLTEEATCALPVRQSPKGLLCLHPYSRQFKASYGAPLGAHALHLSLCVVCQCSRKFGRRLGDRKMRKITLCLGLFTVALVATWFVTLALKMERTWDVSWAAVSFPLWIAFGSSLAFTVTTICAQKPSYGGIVMVRASGVQAAGA